MITDQNNPTTSHHDDLPASSDLDLGGGCDIIREGKKKQRFLGRFLPNVGGGWLIPKKGPNP